MPGETSRWTANFAKARAFIRERGAGIAVEVLINFVAPFLIYDLTKRSLGDVHALIASSGPPIAWSIVEFVRRRRIDALSILVLTGIALSLLAFIGGGGVRFLQLREKLVTGLIGLIFLGSAAIGRPLIYQLARATMMRRSSSEAASFAALRDNPHFRRAMTVMTLVWGFGLVAEAALGCVLVFALSIREFLLVSPAIGYGTMGALGLWTFWYVRGRRKIGEARRLAEEAAAAADAETETPTGPA
ncbi:MAG TPA: VC0807 family protein [Caulobacteraceae bacterium]